MNLPGSLYPACDGHGLSHVAQAEFATCVGSESSGQIRHSQPMKPGTGVKVLFTMVPCAVLGTRANPIFSRKQAPGGSK